MKKINIPFSAIIGILIGIKLLGLLIIIVGIRSCWKSFINSKCRFAVRVSGLFSINTLQDKLEKTEREIEELEQASSMDWR